MLTKCKLLNCDVEIDKEQTAQWYATAGDWGCDCTGCLNFLELARQGLLPHSILSLLDSLSIPATKATYVCLLDGEQLYEFSYRIAGNILAVHAPWEEYGRCCHDPYPYGAPDFPTPHFDIQFIIELPQIIA